MRRILSIAVAILCAFICFAQNDVTKFLGFPVDGAKSEMIKNLKSKGFKSADVGGGDVLTGRFNGTDVSIHIMTEKGKVSRIAICDENPMNETDIKIRFNRLCNQFKDNGKYLPLDDYIIPKDEDISYEMTVRNKRYEAVFYQMPEGEAMEQVEAAIMKYKSKYTPEQLESPTDEIISGVFEIMMNAVKNKPVWFMISEMYGEYYITMFYDNEYNRAKGEDL